MTEDLAALSHRFMEAVRDRELPLLGSVGLARSRYRQTGSMDGDRRDTAYMMTDVWVERDGCPQLVTRHVSPLEP